MRCGRWEGDSASQREGMIPLPPGHGKRLGKESLCREAWSLHLRGGSGGGCSLPHWGPPTVLGLFCWDPQEAWAHTLISKALSRYCALWHLQRQCPVTP